MKIYNTLSRKVEDFKPIDTKRVSFYSCGPTVYLEPHIGNWRTFINYDLLARTLRIAGYNLVHVLNITDVGHLVSDADEGQDKLAKTAREQRKTAWQVADQYIKAFESGLDSLNIRRPDHMPKATDHIPQQIAMIKKLQDLGYTYKTADGIYFDTAKSQDYGGLARADLAGQKAGARVGPNPQKHHPQDFALWKFSPHDEQRDMEWKSPWGIGFPGWHIECSAMALEYLGPTIDIHGGGIDHIPIHHCNEIAQSQAVNQAKFANYWFHSAFMTVDGVKMSKSLGNVYTLEDLQGRGVEPLAFRLLVSQAHYRKESNFTWDAALAAQQRLNHLRAFADLVWQPNGTADVNFDTLSREFESAIQNDLDTPMALEILGNAVNTIGNNLPSTSAVDSLRAFLGTIDNYLGLDLSTRDDIDQPSKELLVRRQTARDNSEWAASDKIRLDLLEKGIQINDTPHGQVWARTD